MPNTKRPEPPTAEELARVVTGPDPDRFYCPHPGCNRSFAELWRLKVHYRAPPDVRGSGKERGHGTELQFCPKCGKDLRPGKHHVGCSAGKSAPRQAAKRQRQQQMSSTTESGGPTQATTGGTEATAGTWEQAAAQQQAKRQQFVVTVQQRAGGGSSASMDVKAAAARAQACRLEEAMKRQLEVVPTGDLLFHPHPAALHGMSAAQPQQAQQHHPAAPQHFFPPLPAAATTAASAVPQGQHPPQAPQQQLSGLDLPGGSSAAPRSFSPSPLELFGDHPLFGGSSTGGARPGASPAPPHGALLGGLDDDDFLRIPSPPPLPADWEAAPRPGLLFDFDQFDANKRHQAGPTAPMVTVTTAMNPVDVSNPSDDYIWQILFAGENDAVPKRVTAHLHHPPTQDLSSFLDGLDGHGEPQLADLLADDLPDLLAPGQHHFGAPAQHFGATGQQQQQQQHEQPGSGGTSGNSGIVPEPAGDTALQAARTGGGGGGTSGAQLGGSSFLCGPPAEAQVVPQYRNGGFGSGPVMAHHMAPGPMPAVKLDPSSFLS